MSKKSKKSGKTRPTAWMVLVLILVITNAATLGYFMFFQDTVPAEDVPMGLPDIAGGLGDDMIGNTVTVMGYYIEAAGNHLLVTDPLFFFNNSLDSSNYIVISGAVPESMSASLGQQVAVKGTLEIYDDSDGTKGLEFDSFFDITYDIPDRGPSLDQRYVPYVQFDDIPHLIDPTAEKYAVLYSGGIRPDKAYSRYWNDIIYMYFILQMHGYDSDNIYVIYKDGVGEDTYTPVDYPATHTSLNTVFTQLSGEMGLRDTLFFYTTNHGGYGGISVWDAMDPAGALTHTEVSDWLDMITCHHMIIVMEQCVSGKFISHISAQNRVILTACKDDESSYSADTEGNWDEFVYHFMCALVSFAWNGDGSTVDADFDNDQLISMREAFVWAAIKDSRPETPWYNDNGDGIGYNAIQVVFGGPMYGDNIFL